MRCARWVGVVGAWTAVLLLGAACWGATIQVLPGDDLQTAIDAAAAGDVLEIAAGIHSVPATIHVDKALTITGLGGATVQGTTGQALSVFRILSSQVTIENLEITWSHVLEDGYASPETADSLISVMGSGLSGIVVQNNLLHVPYQGDNMKLWGARALTVDSYACTGIQILGNTVYNTRNGIVIRYGNTAVINDNVVYDTKGGIMNYTSSLADAAQRTMLGNSWGVTHNQWDIVWNSASYDPSYFDSVIGVSLANAGAYVVDRRDAAGAHAVGNRSHIFLDPAGSTSVHEAKGNMHEPYATFALGIEAITETGTIYVDVGTFQEQVVLNKSASVIGTPGAIIQPSATPQSYQLPEEGRWYEPMIFVFGGSVDPAGVVSGTDVIEADLRGLEVDGTNAATTTRFVGLLLRNVIGSISESHFHHLYDQDGEGNGPETFGVFVYGDSDVAVLDNVISDFSRGGVVIQGDRGGPLADPRAVVEGNVVTGNGFEPETGWWAENGIQFGYGASGAIRDNTVTGCWSNSSWTSSGIILAATGHVDVLGNLLEDNEAAMVAVGYSRYGWGPSYAVLIEGNEFVDNKRAISLQLDVLDTLITRNVIRGSSSTGISLSNFGTAYAPVGTQIHYNSFIGNPWAVVDFGIGSTVDASLNWWGDANGPTAYWSGGSYLGGGDGVWGDVIFSPWLGQDPDGDSIARGVQVTGPVLIVVAPVGPEPVGGYLNEAILGSNDLPFGDTIEVRHGTYDVTEPVTDGVTVVSEIGSTENTVLNGALLIDAVNVLIGQMRQGFTINAPVTVGAGIDASTIHINWNDIYSLITNNGDKVLDATFNYWGEGSGTAGRVLIHPFLPVPAADIIGYIDDYGFNVMQAITFARLLEGGRPAGWAEVATHLISLFGMDPDEAMALIREYGLGRVKRALQNADDLEEFLVNLLGYAVGGPAGGGGSLLGGGAGGTAGISKYCAGCSVPLLLELIHPVTGEVVDDACVSFSVCRTLEDGTVEIVLFGVVPFDGDLGAYALDLETDRLVPGIYDVYLGTDDGRSRSFQIEIY